MGGMRRFLHPSLIALGCAALLLAACGGEGGGEGTPTVTEPTPTATTPTPKPKAVTGLFTEARESPPDTYIELGPPPISQFEPWDGTSTILYDRENGETANLGQGSIGRFNPDGTWMVWNSGPPDDFENSTVWVIELGTLEQRSLGPGWFLRYASETKIVVQVRVEGQSTFEVVDIVTGERESSDGQPTPDRTAAVDGYVFLRTSSGLITGLATHDGEVVLTFEASRGVFAGSNDIVLATVPNGRNINFFAVDIVSGTPTFIASAPYNGPPFSNFGNYPLAANDDIVIWTEHFCTFSEPARTLVFDRTSGTIVELDRVLWATLTPDGLIASGIFGANLLVDPDTYEYVFVAPDFAPDIQEAQPSPDVTWSPNYRFASRGYAGGRGACT